MCNWMRVLGRTLIHKQTNQNYHTMKKIEATIGYREEYDNGEIRYYYGSSDNGFCYKDDEAFQSGEGVCYIREAMFDNISEDFNRDYVTLEDLEREGECYTRKLIIAEARSYWRDEIPKDYPYTEKFLVWVANICYDIVDWQGIDIILDELDWDFWNPNDPDLLPYPWEWKKTA